MKKFDEICNAFDDAQQEFSNFREASLGFGEQICQKLVAHFGAPADRITMYRIGTNGSFDVANPPLRDFAMMREDGFWEFGIGFTIFCDPSTYPRDTVLLYLRVRRGLDGQFHAQLQGPPKQTFIIEPDKEESFEPFFDYIFQTIIDSYKTGLTRLVKTETVNRIGFDLNEMVTSAQAQEEA